MYNIQLITYTRYIIHYIHSLHTSIACIHYTNNINILYITYFAYIAHASIHTLHYIHALHTYISCKHTLHTYIAYIYYMRTLNKYIFYIHTYMLYIAYLLYAYMHINIQTSQTQAYLRRSVIQLCYSLLFWIFHGQFLFQVKLFIESAHDSQVKILRQFRLHHLKCWFQNGNRKESKSLY